MYLSNRARSLSGDLKAQSYVKILTRDVQGVYVFFFLLIYPDNSGPKSIKYVPLSSCSYCAHRKFLYLRAIAFIAYKSLDSYHFFFFCKRFGKLLAFIDFTVVAEVEY